MKGIVKTIILVINILFALLLLGCYLSSVINFAKIPVMGLLNLAYPMLFFINLGFLLFWMFLFKKYFLISFIAILIRIDYVPAYFQFSRGEKIDSASNGINIMSFNLHAFRDLDDWSRSPEYVQQTLDLISEWNPDIICMQEFYSKKNKEELVFNTLNRIQKQSGIRYYYAANDKKDMASGNIIFSRFPIVSKGRLHVGDTNSCRFIFADILINKDTVRIYNFHLASFNLDDKDAKLFDELKENFESEKGKTLMRKLSVAQKLHYQEVDFLKAHTVSSPYKNIICGDFNDPPASYVYQKLSSKMHDAFRKAGSGTGTTYNGRFPAFRIDYILLNRQFKTLAFKTKPVDFSDHFPIFAVFEK